MKIIVFHCGKNGQQIQIIPLQRKKRAVYSSGWSYIIMPEELLFVLGFDGPGIVVYQGFAAVLTKAVKLNFKLNDLLTFIFLNPKVYYFTPTVSFLLYVVGDMYGSYLRYIPIAKQTTEKVVNVLHSLYKPKNLEFHPLQTGNVNDIQIKLLKTYGEFHQFAVQDIHIFISLIIRLTL